MLRYSLAMLVGFVLAGPALAQSWADGLFDEKSKDFGSVPRGPELSHSFKIKNTTRGTVAISGARVSCNICSSVEVGKSQLEPGEETAVTVKMFTSRFIGVKTIHIYVTFGQPQYAEVLLWTQANSRDDIAVSPDTLAFGSIRRGAAPSLSTTVSFYGGQASEVTGVDTETNYIQTEVKKVESRNGTSEVAYQITAKLRADAPVGRWYTDLWVKTNNPSMARLRIPLTVTIESPLSVTPGVVSLGELKVGAPAERKVTLRGVSAFKVKEMKGVDGEVEVKDSTEGSKQVHILTVRVKPAKAGALNRTVTVVTDLEEEGKIEFAVKGQVSP